MIDAGKPLKLESYTEKNTFKPGDRVLLNHWVAKNYIDSTYNTTVLESFYDVKLCLIESHK